MPSHNSLLFDDAKGLSPLVVILQKNRILDRNQQIVEPLNFLIKQIHRLEFNLEFNLDLLACKVNRFINGGD